MKYDLTNPVDKQRFKDKSNKLFEEKAFVELRKILPIGTNQQKKYAHVLFAYFAIEYGETAEYIKQFFFKQVVNKEIFKTEHINTVTGVARVEWRSINDLDTKELTIAIDRFRDYASKEAGIYLPEPHEEEFLRSCEVEISKNTWI